MSSIYGKKRQDKTKEEIDFLRTVIDRYEGLEYAQRISEGYGQKAKAAVEKYRLQIPQNEFTPIMISAIEELHVRKK